MVLSHSLAPSDRAQFEHVAKFIPPIPKEPAVATLNPYAQEMATLGYPGPFSVSRADPVLVRDRDGKPFDLAMPGDDGPANRRRRTALMCLALNQLCGFEAADTDTGSMADAAELRP